MGLDFRDTLGLPLKAGKLTPTCGEATSSVEVPLPMPSPGPALVNMSWLPMWASWGLSLFHQLLGSLLPHNDIEELVRFYPILHFFLFLKYG